LLLPEANIDRDWDVSTSLALIKGDVVAGRLMYSLATDGSSDEEDKFFPIIITHEDVHTGLVTTLQRLPDTSMRITIIYISVQGKSIGNIQNYEVFEGVSTREVYIKRYGF
jgi:hypothetical protein